MDVEISDYQKKVDMTAPPVFGKLRENHFKFLGSNLKFPNYRYSSFVNLSLPNFEIKDIKNPNELSSGVSINSHNSIKIENDFSEELLNKYLSEKDVLSEQAIDHFHYAFTNSIKIISIPDNYSDSSPIQINLDSEEDDVLSSIFIFTGANSSSRIMLHQKSESDFFSSRVKVIAGENSSIELIQADIVGENTVYFGKTESITKNSATVKLTSFSFGGKYIKSDIISYLKGEGSSSKITMLYLTKDAEKQNINAESRHIGKATSSDILTKGAIGGKSKALSTGNIYIGQDAFSSNGYETQNALLLSTTAEADAIPNLEIHNHDVKCSHGSTIGQVDKDSIFYLMSRGISKKSALGLIVKGFFSSVLEEINDEELVKNLNNSIDNSIQKLK